MRHNARAEYIRATERAATRLGLPSHGPDSDIAIVDYCRRAISRLTAEHGLPPNMGKLLEWVASCLDVEFVEIHSDEDLAELARKITLGADPALALLMKELDDDTDAITIQRRAPKPWERRYLAVINCRGQHYHRRFFTKWHELAHRLLDGEQLALAFRQTPVDRKDPEEILVDKIAGEIAFFPDIVGPRARECLAEFGLTFRAIDALRESVAQEASRQATAFALLRYVDHPAWYLRCAVSLKRSEAREARSRNGSTKPVPKLRVQEASPNDPASRSGVRIHQSMRVPESSLIARAHVAGRDRTGSEQLDEWETSSGGPIGSGQLFVDAEVMGSEVLAFVSIVAR